MDKATQYPNAPIYHYGSYEPRAISTLARRYQTDAENLSKRLVNVNGYIYGKVYFPVRSNGLKDIGTFIGAKWPSPNASGLQSLVWRHAWEENLDVPYQEKLVIYNKEDCQALKLLTDEISKISHSENTLSEIDYADKRSKSISETQKQLNSQFNKILVFSHFGYNKKKISFRQELNDKDNEYKSEMYQYRAEKQRKMLLNIRRRAKKSYLFHVINPALYVGLSL